MLLGADEVAKIIARHDLVVMRDAETSGIAFAKGKLERLVGKRTGGGQVAREEGDHNFRGNRTDELLEVATLLGQRRGALDSVDRFRRSIASRDVKQPE